MCFISIFTVKVLGNKLARKTIRKQIKVYGTRFPIEKIRLMRCTRRWRGLIRRKLLGSYSEL